jgi:hypothetical protein
MLPIRVKNQIDPVFQYFYWVRWGRSFFEAFSDDLAERNYSHWFVAPQIDCFDYSTVYASERTCEEVLCLKCAGFEYSVCTRMRVEIPINRNPFECLEVNDRCLMPLAGVELFNRLKFTGVGFLPVFNTTENRRLQDEFQLIQPKTHLLIDRLRHISNCPFCSRELQCGRCGNISTFCKSCGASHKIFNVDNPPYCAFKLADWSGDDFFGVSVMDVFTGSALKAIIESGLFSFTFGPCSVEKFQASPPVQGAAGLRAASIEDLIQAVESAGNRVEP